MIRIKSATQSQVAFTLNEKGVYDEWYIELVSKETYQSFSFSLGGTATPDISSNISRYNQFDVNWDLEEGQYNYGVFGITGSTVSQLLESGRLNVEKI
jgi:hypothetical protein